MSSERHTAIIRRLFEEMSADRMDSMAGLDQPVATGPPAPLSGNGTAHEVSGRSNQEAAQDARLARIAAHVAEESALLRRRS